MGVKGYKVFNPDWTCRGFQYEVGKTYTLDAEKEGALKLCNVGFHFCTKASDCFKYYGFDSNNHVAEIEALGEIKEDDDSTKCCTDVIRIVKELDWHEVLDLVNNGKNCTGLNNSGNHNSGNYNSGYCNSGNCNSGNWNNGNWNSGDWNKTNYSSGCFNTEETPLMFFNKSSDVYGEKWRQSAANIILNTMPTTVVEWVRSENMTDEEKENHPEHKTMGGYLKTYDATDTRQLWWESLTEKEKSTIWDIPNFDADIFKEITGIDVRKDS